MRRTTLGAVSAAIALMAGPALADARPRSSELPPATIAIDRDDALAQRQEKRATALINAATSAMRRADPSCVQRWDLEQPATITHAAPSRALLDTFVLLRRPAIPQDGDFVARGGLRFLSTVVRGVYVDWIRMARAADGSTHYLVVAQDRNRPDPISRASVRLQARLLRRMVRDEPERVRRMALRANARMMREEQPAGGFPSREAILGGDGGVTDLAYFRTHGMFSSSQRGDDDRSTVTGWLPDGVATIDVTYPGRVSYGPHRPGLVYGDDRHLTVKVQDNVASFQVDRPAHDAIPPLTVWRAADGAVIRTVRTR
jgi:hypothetical protein